MEVIRKREVGSSPERGKVGAVLKEKVKGSPKEGGHS